MILPSSYHKALLEWYGTYGRTLPWRRFSSGADPYGVWISEIMLQQTPVPTVKDYYLRFLEKWPRVVDLAQASLDEVLHVWQGLGYYSRARNLHKCAQIIQAKYGGKFPSAEEELVQLPGIGPYTAAAIRSIAFNLPAVVVDGNIERIMSRLFRLETALPRVKKEIYEKASTLISEQHPSDYAQALMDLGSSICTPKAPQCSLCPIQYFCASYGLDPESFPKKAPQEAKPTRQGTFLWIENERGEVLLEKRPLKGLLAGLMGFPSQGWDGGRSLCIDHIGSQKPIKKAIKHTFTHFHLIGTVVKAFCPREKMEGTWVLPEDLALYALPRLMQKVKEAVLQEEPQ